MSPSNNNFYQKVILTFMWLERAALEASGQERSLLLMDRECQREGQPGNGTVSTETPLLSSDAIGSPNAFCVYTIFPPNRFCRYLTNLLLILGWLAIESTYFFFFGARAEENDSIRNVIRLYTFCLAVVLSFLFAAPMHTALGYFSKDVVNGSLNKDKLLADSGCRFFTTFCLLATLVTMTSEYILLLLRTQGLSVSIVVGFPMASLIHLGTLFGHLLLLTFAMRGINVRLKEIDSELEVQLGLIQENMRYTSNNPDYATMLRRWSMTYGQLGQDVSELSDRFGARMALAMFLLLVTITSIISMVWQNSGEKWTRTETAGMLTEYMMYSCMFMMAISAVCYPVTMCTQHIGPKLVVLALTSQNMVPDDRLARTAQLLSNAFLLAPIEMAVGNFELLPHVANAFAGILLGLLLFALGYNVQF